MADFRWAGKIPAPASTHNVANLPTKRVSGKLFNLFLASVPAFLNDFYQMAVPWSDHHMLFLSCRLERPREVAKFYSIRRFQDVNQSKLVAAAEVLDWRSVYFVTGINVKVDLFYSMHFYLMDTFAPKRLVRVRTGDDMCGVRNWLDDRVELAIWESNDSYDVWSNNVNRVRLWVDYIAKRRQADALVNRKYSQFVSINLDPGLPPNKLYDGLGVINCPERFSGNVDVERFSSFFLTRPSLSTGISFDVPVSTNVPELSFVSVTEDEVFNAVMSIKLNAAGVDEIPLSFIKSPFPVLLGTLTHVFNHIFTCSEFLARWGASVVLPISKVVVLICGFDGSADGGTHSKN
jgi:hypothetical protein